MKDHPLLFSAPMVRELLSGKKTQTRRIVNLKQLRVRTRNTVESDFPDSDYIVAKPGRHRVRLNDYGAVVIADLDLGVRPGEFDFECSFAEGQTHLANHGTRLARWTITPTASRLWVKETWRAVERPSDSVDGILFRADEAFVPIQNTREAAELWVGVYDRPNGKPARWRPAIFLPRWASRITLQVSSVRLERVQDISEVDAVSEGVASVAEYADLWRTINGRESWAANPWVWAVSFARVT